MTSGPCVVNISWRSYVTPGVIITRPAAAGEAKIPASRAARTNLRSMRTATRLAQALAGLLTLYIFRTGISGGRRRERPENRACRIALARGFCESTTGPRGRLSPADTADRAVRAADAPLAPASRRPITRGTMQRRPGGGGWRWRRRWRRWRRWRVEVVEVEVEVEVEVGGGGGGGEVEAEVEVAGKEEADRAAGVGLAVAARSSCLPATTPGVMS